MLKIIDEERNLDMTAKFQLGQEVVLTSYQSYRKGVIVGIIAQTNDKGTSFIYTVELYVNKKSTPKFKKCPERFIFSSVKDALKALSELAEKYEQSETEENE